MPHSLNCILFSRASSPHEPTMHSAFLPLQLRLWRLPRLLSPSCSRTFPSAPKTIGKSSMLQKYDLHLFNIRQVALACILDRWWQRLLVICIWFILLGFQNVFGLIIKSPSLPWLPFPSRSYGLPRDGHYWLPCILLGCATVIHCHSRRLNPKKSN